jgi:hypothetical protein
MSEAIEKYLAKRADLDTRPLVTGETDGIAHAIVIPVLAEGSELFAVLNSLNANATELLNRCLVVCVVNNRIAPHATEEELADNSDTLETLKQMTRETGSLRLAYVDACTEGNAFPEDEGVGLARKLGLDHALAVLDRNGKSAHGLLVSLDADTVVEPNYLETIFEHFRHSNASAGVVPFEHRIDGDRDQQAAILCYELFLRYHVLGLGYAGSPYAFHSVGSTMVCRAEAYAAVSGMNRRQAGEDFYFLQQLAKSGPMSRIDGTAVYPSPRPSDRVPFGTGRRVRRHLAGEQDEYLLYHPDIYRALRTWLELVESSLHKHDHGLVHRIGERYPEVAAFLEQQGFETAWNRIQSNSRNEDSLRAQFHRWFDGFRTLKLAHHLRDNGLPQQPMFEAIAAVLEMLDSDAASSAARIHAHELGKQRRLLETLRILEQRL